MSTATDWHPTACILCSLNCGILARTDGTDILKIKGDPDHPASHGYLCNKAARLPHYQAAADRILTPLQRQADGSHQPVSWETAINGIAAQLGSIHDSHGGASIFYYGGGGQGNHLPGGYARTLTQPLGVQYRSNALAQEKTGEFWVCERMFGGYPHGDFDNAEVVIFLGKNPWQSHGFQRARVIIQEIAKDPERALVVIDPKRTESADHADVHLAVKPGRDAWLLAGMVACVVQEGLANEAWLAEHANGVDAVLRTFINTDIAACAERSGISDHDIRMTARLIANAESVAVFEDLGTQMNRHSTLVSYLQRLLWVLCGHFGAPGSHYTGLSMANLAGGRETGTSPVVGARLINGLVPCNRICDEVLTDHPDRYRAMLIESANPVHSLADSPRWRAAMAALECSVCIDVAMTETARHCQWVLPATNQYEKAEATFFALEFPANFFHIRRPLFSAPTAPDGGEGPLDEAEIHMRLAEAMGLVPEGVQQDLADTLARGGRGAFREAVFAGLAADPTLMQLAPGLLYRTLGPTLPHGLHNAAALWALCHQFAAANADAVRAAGIAGEGPDLGEALFDHLLASPSGAVICREDWSAVFARLPGGRVQLDLPEFLADAAALDAETPSDVSAEFPLLLSAGERRAFTANTIIRDPAWRKKDAAGALHIHPADAARLNLGDGSTARIASASGALEVPVELNDRMQPGHVSLPNGTGVDYPGAEAGVGGVAPNELTSSEWRDGYVGTPWHKIVPVRVEPA